MCTPRKSCTAQSTRLVSNTHRWLFGSLLTFDCGSIHGIWICNSQNSLRGAKRLLFVTGISCLLPCSWVVSIWILVALMNWQNYVLCSLRSPSFADALRSIAESVPSEVNVSDPEPTITRPFCLLCVSTKSISYHWYHLISIQQPTWSPISPSLVSYWHSW